MASFPPHFLIQSNIKSHRLETGNNLRTSSPVLGRTCTDFAATRYWFSADEFRWVDLAGKAAERW